MKELLKSSSIQDEFWLKVFLGPWGVLAEISTKSHSVEYALSLTQAIFLNKNWVLYFCKKQTVCDFQLGLPY